MGSWSELPFDVLEEIAKKLCHNDLRHFGAVCKSWRSLYLENLSRLPKDLPLDLCNPRPFGTPILLLSCKPDSVFRKYVSLQEGTVNHRKIFLPEAANRWICGSNWGWLVLVSIRGKEVCLYNPLTRSLIQLPSLDMFPELGISLGDVPDKTPRNCFQFINKAVISCDPISNSNECVVLAIVGNVHQLCFCKLGDKRWTKAVGSPYAIQDVIYYENKFYAITQGGIMVSYQGNNLTESQVVACGPEMPAEVPRRYLLVSEGNLIQLFRYTKSYSDDDDYIDDNYNDDENDDEDENEVEANDKDERYWLKTETVKFELYELVKGTQQLFFRYVSDDFKGLTEYSHKWTELSSLNEHSLFLGFNSSLSVPARSLPNYKGNQIYFTDDHYWNHFGNFFWSKVPVKAYHDIGIFDMDDKSVISYHLNDPNDLMPSVWITPNPWHKASVG